MVISGFAWRRSFSPSGRWCPGPRPGSVLSPANRGSMAFSGRVVSSDYAPAPALANLREHLK